MLGTRGTSCSLLLGLVDYDYTAGCAVELFAACLPVGIEWDIFEKAHVVSCRLKAENTGFIN